MRHTFQFVFLKLLLLFNGPGCYGQSYYFRHYGADDGLAHNRISAIIQDSKGLIWIGSRGGLNRFDGYTFKTYRNNGNKFGNIGNNIISAIAEDKKGMLWLGSGQGILKYDPYKEIFTAIETAPQAAISHISVDAQNNIWFLADGELYEYKQEQNRVIDLKMQGSCLNFDSQMKLWIGSNDGVLRMFNTVDRSFVNIRIVNKNVPADLRTISKILPIDSNRLLIGCFKQGLKSYNIKTGLIRSLSLSPIDGAEIYIRDIAAENTDKYWVATESGIYIYNLTNNSCQNLHKRADDPYAITDNAVYTICKDKQGGMWAGTFFGGLNYYSKENSRFEKYYPLLGTNSISGNAVREISPDNKGNLWIGTEDAGLNKLNLKTGIFTSYTAYGKPDHLSYPNIHGLLAVGDQLYLGPFLHGMEVMNTRTGLVTDRFKLIDKKNKLVSNFVFCIHQTRDSTLLIGTIGTGSGLFSYNIKAKTFTRVKQIPYHTSVYDIKEDHEGNIWVGSLGRGALFYNFKTRHHGAISFGDRVKNKTINEFPVYGILEDSNHAMWFTTEGGGLIKLASDRKTIKKFTTEQNLPTNVFFRAMEDNYKRLWISSLKGLICLDLHTEKFKIYTSSNGLITNQFNYNSAYKDPNGKMYFGTVKGLIAFDPAEFRKTDISPSTYITGFQVNNKELIPGGTGSLLSKSLIYTDTIVLTHDQNNFSIEFAALNYASPEVTHYEYLMKGLDGGWTYLKSNRKAFFTDLSPGSYTFVVRAESNVGSWKGKERRLEIKILPPFWKSYWAFFLYIIVSGAILYLSVSYYHHYTNRKNSDKLRLFEHKKEKEVYQSKIEFFTNIAHEIQTPLTLILVPVEQLIKKVQEQPDIKKSVLMVEKNARRLAELTGQLLDFRQAEMNQFGLNFVNVDINNLLREQIEVFKQEAEKQQITLIIELPKNHVVAFADPEALMKICTNLISNAIKYAAAKAVVSLPMVKAGDEQFTIRFMNDGRAISEEFREKIFEPFFRLRNNDKQGTGIGLSLAKSLAGLHNGSLVLVSADLNNIVFELSLPLHQQFEFTLSNWKKIK